MDYSCLAGCFLPLSSELPSPDSPSLTAEVHMNHGAVLETRQDPDASISTFPLLLNWLYRQSLLDSSLFFFHFRPSLFCPLFYGKCCASISCFVANGRALPVLPCLFLCSTFPYSVFFFQLWVTYSVFSVSTSSSWVLWISKGFVLDVSFLDDNIAVSRFNYLKQLLDILHPDLSHTVSATLSQQMLTAQAE